MDSYYLILKHCVHSDKVHCECVYLLQQQCTELLSAVLESESVCAVHHPHQPVCALKVVPPVGAQRLLTPDIPNIQFKPREDTERRERERSRERQEKKTLILDPACKILYTTSM